jgi:hypothetical protein
MRSSPFTSLAVALRIFAKAVVLLLILNFVCLTLNFNPIAALIRLNTWWLVGHGRARLVYPSDFQNGQLPVEALVGAHALAYSPKAADEFRVVVLGESGIAGWGLSDYDTFTAQLTVRNIKIGDKRVVAYNLAYPSPNVARDVLILDEAMKYQPDLVIWFLTPAALDDAPSAIGTNSVLFDLNRARLQRLTDTFGLQEWFNAHIDPEPAWRRWIAIHDQDTLPVWLNTLLYPFTAPDLGLSNRRLGMEPIPAVARYTLGRAGFDPMPNQTWQFLDMGRSLAKRNGARLLLVNEPMLIGRGANSDRNYNLEYERAFYDTYHQKLTEYVTEKGFLFADLWNVMPAGTFTDTPLHAIAAGYMVLVDKIEPELLKVEASNP